MEYTVTEKLPKPSEEIEILGRLEFKEKIASTSHKQVLSVLRMAESKISLTSLMRNLVSAGQEHGRQGFSLLSTVTRDKANLVPTKAWIKCNYVGKSTSRLKFLVSLAD